MGSSRPRPLRVIVLSRIAVVALLHFESAAAFLFASPHGVAVSQRRSVLPQLRTSGNGCRGAAQAVEAGTAGPAFGVSGCTSPRATGLLAARGCCGSRLCVCCCVAATGWRRGQDWRGAQSGWRRAGRTCVQNTGTPEGAGAHLRARVCTCGRAGCALVPAAVRGCSCKLTLALCRRQQQ